MWNEETVSRLRELVAERYSAGAVAEMMTVEFGSEFTRNMVMSKGVREGLRFDGRLKPKRRLARTRTRVTAVTRVAHSGKVRSRGFHRSWKLVGAAPIMESGERRLKAAPSWWRGIGIVELRVGVCRFPWEGDDGVVAYCGEPVTDGAGSWCRRCRGIVYRRREKGK